MTDPINGLIMAACILVLGCIGLSFTAVTLFVRQRRRSVASVNESVNG